MRGWGPDGCRWHRWLTAGIAEWRKGPGASHRGERLRVPVHFGVAALSSGCCRYWKRSVCCSPRGYLRVKCFGRRRTFGWKIITLTKMNKSKGVVRIYLMSLPFCLGLFLLIFTDANMSVEIHPSRTDRTVLRKASRAKHQASSAGVHSL